MTSRATPTTTAEFRAMGLATPKPAKRERAQSAGIKRTSSLDNTPHRQQVRTEEGYYPTFEAMLGLHDCDFFHPTTSHFTRRRKGQKGWADYVVLGLGWHAFVELKAVSLATGRAGKLAPEQERYRAAIIQGNGEYRSFLLPNEWGDVEDWLNDHTGKGLRGTWRLSA